MIPITQAPSVLTCHVRSSTIKCLLLLEPQLPTTSLHPGTSFGFCAFGPTVLSLRVSSPPATFLLSRLLFGLTARFMFPHLPCFPCPLQAEGDTPSVQHTVLAMILFVISLFHETVSSLRAGYGLFLCVSPRAQHNAWPLRELWKCLLDESNLRLGPLPSQLGPEATALECVAADYLMLLSSKP